MNTSILMPTWLADLNQQRSYAKVCAFYTTLYRHSLVNIFRNIKNAMQYDSMMGDGSFVPVRTPVTTSLQSVYFVPKVGLVNEFDNTPVSESPTLVSSKPTRFLHWAFVWYFMFSGVAVAGYVLGTALWHAFLFFWG